MHIQKISIQLGDTIKDFNIKLSYLEDVLKLISYYNGSEIENNTYLFKSSVPFNIVDLYISSFATPQPRYEVA